MNKVTQFFKERAAVFIIGAIAVISLILVIIVFTLASSGNGRRSLTIEDIVGSAFILKNDGQVSADINMQLESGDVLITSADSTVRLLIDKDKRIYIEPETTIYVHYTDAAEKGSIVVNISEGAATCRLDSKLANNALFEVRTPNSVISAVGTVFRTQFDYYDDYRGYTEVKLTDVQCAEGSVNIQLYDNNASPADQLMLLAEGKSARLMTGTDTARYEFLNAETDINTMSSDMLKTYIRIAAERRTAFSLTELNNAYQNILNGGLVTEPYITTTSEAATEATTTITTAPPVVTTVPDSTSETETVSSVETVISDAESTLETTSQTEITSQTVPATESTAISVAPVTTAVYTVSTTAEETVTSETSDSIVTTSTQKSETIAPIRPAETITTTPTTAQTKPEVTTVTAATEPTETEQQVTKVPFATESTKPETSVPWWEIINSVALTKD